jgi:hypothetical protein
MMRNKKRQKSVYIRETVPYVYSTVNIFPVLGGTDVYVDISSGSISSTVTTSRVRPAYSSTVCPEPKRPSSKKRENIDK